MLLFACHVKPIQSRSFQIGIILLALNGFQEAFSSLISVPFTSQNGGVLWGSRRPNLGKVKKKEKNPWHKKKKS